MKTITACDLGIEVTDAQGVFRWWLALLVISSSFIITLLTRSLVVRSAFAAHRLIRLTKLMDFPVIERFEIQY